VHTTTRKSGGKVQLVFALSRKRVARHNGPHIYVEIVGEVQEDGVGTPVPPELTEFLGDFTNKISNEFLKVLPSRCFVDHCIELELGLQPLARAAYQLSGLELEELSDS
jgi:hypothetical protein